jgi:hypothetical protein
MTRVRSEGQASLPAGRRGPGTRQPKGRPSEEDGGLQAPANLPSRLDFRPVARKASRRFVAACQLKSATGVAP